jgi:glucokinase
VDIGGTSTKAGLVTTSGQVSQVNSIATKPDVESFFRELVRLISRTLEGGVSQLGVAVAGFVDETRSHLEYNSNLPWLEKFPLRERLREQFPALAIELEIDSNASTMAEYRFGSGRGARRFLCLTCGTGLGVGMTVDGVPLRFAYGCMGDIGHTILMRDGPVCACGGRGCAEVILSSNTLAGNYQQVSGRTGEISLRDVIAAAQGGDGVACEVLGAAGEWLGMAVASMANTFFPDHIAIAGGLSAAGDVVLKPAERVFRLMASDFAKSRATFGGAELGAAATLVGAGWPFWR